MFKENVKKVLFAVPSVNLGGAERVLLTIAKALPKFSQIDVLFLCSKSPSAWDELGTNCKLHFVEKPHFTGVLSWMVAVRRLNQARNGFDLVISSATKINGLLGMMQRLNLLRSRNLVARESTQIMDRFSGFKRLVFALIYKLGYGVQHLVVFQTQFMRGRLEATIKKSKYWPSLVLANPIDVSEILSKSKENIQLPTTKEYIVAVGRLIDLKGFDLLIKSLVLLSVDVHLLIVGEGPEKNKLIDLADRNRVRSKVHFVGYQSNPYPYMKHAKVCVIASRIEGFPNTLLQMMAVNDRVVSTLCAGDIDQMQGVISCPPNDEHLLTSAIEEAFSLSQQEAEKNRLSFDKELSTRNPKEYVKQIIEAVGQNTLSCQ